MTVSWRPLIHCLDRFAIYLLLSGTSSTIAMQYPWGFTEVAFFTILIFIVISLSCAGRGMRQRHECRFEAALVTCRQVHVAKLGERVCNAAARAHRHKRAVAAFFPGVESIELQPGGVAARIAPVVGVTG